MKNRDAAWWEKLGFWSNIVGVVSGLSVVWHADSQAWSFAGGLLVGANLIMVFHSYSILNYSRRLDALREQHYNVILAAVLKDLNDHGLLK